jgi:bzd-type benzoyl-CoA reductase N subunit
MLPNPWNTFAAVVTDPYTGWAARYPGRRAFGTLCTYAPEEILHAAGFVPVRLLPSPTPIVQANAHLQSYTCSLARNILEQALQGRFNFLAGVLFSHTCDTMQGLADIWRLNFPSQFVATVVQPVALTSPQAQAYLMAELRQLIARLEAHFGLTITDDSLRASIRLYNQNRELLSQLYAVRERLSSVDVWQAVTAAMLMPKEEHNALLSQLIGVMTGDVAIPAGSATQARLILIGATLDDATLLEIIEAAGARVVADDLCTGARYFDTSLPQVLDNLREADPVEALAQRQLQRLPCPCKYRSLDARAQHLLALAAQHHADGVVFVLKKFCEPHTWDYPYLAAALTKAGLPHLLLETEQTTPVEQLRTRVEAFLEMLHA